MLLEFPSVCAGHQDGAKGKFVAVQCSSTRPVRMQRPAAKEFMCQDPDASEHKVVNTGKLLRRRQFAVPVAHRSKVPCATWFVHMVLGWKWQHGSTCSIVYSDQGKDVLSSMQRAVDTAGLTWHHLRALGCNVSNRGGGATGPSKDVVPCSLWKAGACSTTC